MGDLKPGWAEQAGKEAAEREQGERFAPIVTLAGQAKRHWIPVLPEPKPEQIDNVRRASKKAAERRKAEARIDAIFASSAGLLED